MKTLVFVLAAFLSLMGVYAAMAEVPVAPAAGGVDAEVDARAKAAAEAQRKAVLDLKRRWAHAADAGDPEAMIRVAALTEHDKDATPADISAALDLYEKAADKGQDYARERMCHAYLLGDHRPVDVAKGATYCNALPNKNPLSLFWVGYDYENGITGPKDEAGAIHFYIDAAKAGSGDAADALGRIALDKGQPENARPWLTHGVYLGSAAAMDRLAGMLTAGQGGPVETAEAAWLYRAAARFGNAHAMEQVKTLPPAQTMKIPNFWGAKGVEMKRTYQDGIVMRTSTLTAAKIATSLQTVFPAVLTKEKEWWVTIECFIDNRHRIDVCFLSDDYPPGLHLGGNVENFFRESVTVAESDADGRPTADFPIKLTVRMLMQ